MPRASDAVQAAIIRDAVLPRRAVVAAVLLTTATVLVIWLAAVPWGPIVCTAISPPEPRCVFENRVGTAAVVTTVVVAVGLATVSAPILRRRGYRRVTRIGILLLAVSLLLAYPVVAWSPGFPLPASAGQAAPADPGGTWVSEGGGEPYLVITAVGRFEGYDGCNGFSGSWTRVDGGLIAFHDTVMTLMMCEGGDTWLTGARFAVVEGDRLRILEESRTSIGMLVRDGAAAPQ